MATRIRTVKPDLFRHEGLFELEQETGLPVRLVFIGLFCCSDREGRFKWRPRELALDITPYEDVARLSRVLDALGTRGFLVKYASGGDWYGMIPTFLKHQQINNREQGSQLPGFLDADEVFDFKSLNTDVDASGIKDLQARQPRVNHASTTRLEQEQGEGKGREGKGRELDQERMCKFDSKTAFDAFWKLYPSKKGKAEAQKAWTKVTEDLVPIIMDSLAKHVISRDWIKDDGQYIPMAATWLNKRRFEDEVKPYVQGFSGNTGASGQSRPSLIAQVHAAAAEQERRRNLALEPVPGTAEWEEDFSRIREIDGSIVGMDD